MTRELVVWFEDRAVGRFRQSDDGRQSFSYNASWCEAPNSFAISLSLPLTDDEFDDRTTRAFFGGLLPDDDLRRRLAHILHVSAKNEFALLAEVGRECAGALSLLPPGETPAEPTGDVRVLTGDELASLLQELPARPLLIGADIRLSLAGAQDKIAVRRVDDGFALPTDGGPTTHILKTPIAPYDGTVANECFCMQLAARIGIDAPTVEMRTVGDTPVLLVERFDRERTANGTLRRLHQEDFCQAMAIPPDLKYEAEGGPGTTQIFDLLAEHSSRAAVDRLRLLEMLVFHYLIGNADAHGKNYSLLIGSNGVRLSPIYDAMCTTVYPALSRRMAMKVGSRREFDEVEPRHWQQLAKKAGLAPAIVSERLARFATRLPTLAAELAEHDDYIGHPTVARICDDLAGRCARVAT